MFICKDVQVISHCWTGSVCFRTVAVELPTVSSHGQFVLAFNFCQFSFYSLYIILMNTCLTVYTTHLNEKRECISMAALFNTKLSNFSSFPRFPSEAGESPYITSSGFQFLLLDTASQLWYFILQYLKTAQVHAGACTFISSRIWIMLWRTLMDIGRLGQPAESELFILFYFFPHFSQFTLCQIAH